MPRITETYLKGTYSYTNAEGENRDYTFDGEYEISTIATHNRFETVMFRTDNMAKGPNQVELHCDGHPTEDEVLVMLQAGNFRIPGDW